MNYSITLTPNTPPTVANTTTTNTTSPVECEEGWSEYQSSCYKVFKIQRTYADATANCKSQGAYVASIGSEGENSFVHSELQFSLVPGEGIACDGIMETLMALIFVRYA